MRVLTIWLLSCWDLRLFRIVLVYVGVWSLPLPPVPLGDI